MPKVNEASAADSAAALSCALLSPAAVLKPRLPEAPWATFSLIDELFSSSSLSPSLLVIDWRLSMMAMAADYVVAEVDEIVPRGQIDPDHVMTPGIFVNALVQAPQEN